MKFRAVIQDALYIREFQHIIATLAKLTKDYCIMRISQQQIHFIANEEYGSPSPYVWIAIDAHLYFPEYLMEAAHAEWPHIVLSISAADLGRALAALRNNARSCKFKLNNIQFPCLTIESELQTQDKSRHLNHNVPVDIIPRCDWSAYEVPQVPVSQMVLSVPSIRLMRGLIDKIKNISPNIIFHATSAGELNLVAEADMATLTTRYRRLLVRALDPRSADRGKTQLEASCSIDCRKASIFFNALQLPTEELFIGIAEEQSIHLEILVRVGVALHAVLPAVCVGFN